MNSIEDPLGVNDMQKLATIYRNSDLTYVYVCYDCGYSFENISETLNHVEIHFDTEVNIVNGFGDKISEFVRETVETTENVENTEKMLSDVYDIKFECKIIEQKITNEKDYKVDITADLDEFTNTQPLSQCKLCDQNFNGPSLVLIHLVNEHASATTLKCPQCSQNLMDEATFLRHLHQHIDNNETTFDALSDKVITKCKAVDNVKRPWTKYQMRFLKTCDICSSTFSNRGKLILHMTKEHGKKHIFDCEKCNRKISGKFMFYAHQYGHLTNDDQVSVLGDEVLRQNLRQFLDDNIHCDESTSDKTFGCKLCSHLSVTLRKNAELHILQRHVYYVKGNRANMKYACDICKQSFALSCNLKRHRQTHNLEKPFSCPICNKTFALKRYLKYHELTHSEMKPHQCHMCGSTFKTLARLNRHNRSHSNITTKCTICDKEVKQHRMKQHVRDVHDNEHRPYTCSVCWQAFKTAKTLRNHSYRHGDVKNYECRFHCKEKFISSAARRAHERSKHEPH